MEETGGRNCIPLKGLDCVLKNVAAAWGNGRRLRTTEKVLTKFQTPDLPSLASRMLILQAPSPRLSLTTER